MTAALAKKAIEHVINKVLTLETREGLNKELHILDLSKDTLLIANKYSDTQEFTEAYNEFISTVHRLVVGRKTLDDAIAYTFSGLGSSYFKDYLVTLDFGAARRVITKISRAIPTNKYFGVSFRERNLEELAKDYGLDLDKSSLGKLADRVFLLKGGQISQVQQFSEGNKIEYKLVPVLKITGNTKVKLPELDRSYSDPTAAQHYGQEIDISDGKTDLLNYKQGDPIYIKRNFLSILDIGHAFGLIEPGARSPLGVKISKPMKYSNLLGTEAKAVIEKYNKQLADLHSTINFTFHNTAADSKYIKTFNGVGYVLVVPQHYDINNEYAIDEARILREVTEELSAIALNLPGSNTIMQDMAAKAFNQVVEALGGKPKPLQKHNPVSGKVPVPSAKIKPVSGDITGPNKTKVADRPLVPRLRTQQGKFTSLASLQTLLNLALSQQIQQNMGTGTRRDVLNYRSGRFAESAKVTNMSQSREGMITAFYTYMRNPYGTFSEGGAQSSPRSRDPKLLISKSIREVLATQVNNRLRAVLA
jgi:hypothetical protein